MSGSLAALKSRLNNRKAEAAAKKAQYIRPHKFAPGKNRVRILPGWNAASPDVFYHDFGMHYIKDRDNKTAAVYVCTDKTYGKDCPVCSAVYEGIRVAKDTGNTPMEKLLGQARATARVLVNALIRESDEPNKPVVLELPSGVFDQMVDQMMTFADDGVDVLSVTEGHDFIVTKSGSGLDTEYSVSLAPKPTAVTYDASLVVDLAAYCSQESEQGLLKAVNATTAVTGLPAPKSMALAAPARTGTHGGSEAGAFITPPATATVAVSAPAAAVGAAAVLSAAASAADEAEKELAALEGELMEEAPWEADEVVVEPTPAPAASAAPSVDLAEEINASDDDLESILDGLDDL